MLWSTDNYELCFFLSDAPYLFFYSANIYRSLSGLSAWRADDGSLAKSMLLVLSEEHILIQPFVVS